MVVPVFCFFLAMGSQYRSLAKLVRGGIISAKGAHCLCKSGLYSGVNVATIRFCRAGGRNQGANSVRRIRQHAIWSHKGTFVLAATGSAVGLGNIWKFP